MQLGDAGKASSVFLGQIPLVWAYSPLQIHSIRLKWQMIVDGLREVLAGAEVALGGEHGGMAEQELDLLEFATGGAAEFGAGAPGVVRGEQVSRTLRTQLRRDQV